VVGVIAVGLCYQEVAGARIGIDKQLSDLRVGVQLGTVVGQLVEVVVAAEE
jgi:hypothetical protein